MYPNTKNWSTVNLSLNSEIQIVNRLENKWNFQASDEWFFRPGQWFFSLERGREVFAPPQESGFMNCLQAMPGVTNILNVPESVECTSAPTLRFSMFSSVVVLRWVAHIFAWKEDILTDLPGINLKYPSPQHCRPHSTFLQTYCPHHNRGLWSNVKLTQQRSKELRKILIECYSLVSLLAACMHVLHWHSSTPVSTILASFTERINNIAHVVWTCVVLQAINEVHSLSAIP